MNDPSTWLQFKTFTHTDFWMQTACIQKGTLWWFFLHGTFLVWNYVGTKWKFFMLFYANTYSFLVFLPKLGGSTNLLLLVLDHSLSQSENVLTSRPGGFESWLTLGKSLAVNKREYKTSTKCDQTFGHKISLISVIII